MSISIIYECEKCGCVFTFEFENIKDAIKFLKGLKRGKFPHICPPRNRMLDELNENEYKEMNERENNHENNKAFTSTDR